MTWTGSFNPDDAEAEIMADEKELKVSERALELLTDQNEMTTLLETLTETKEFRIMFASMQEEYISGGPWQHKAAEVCEIASSVAHMIAEGEA